MQERLLCQCVLWPRQDLGNRWDMLKGSVKTHVSLESVHIVIPIMACGTCTCTVAPTYLRVELANASCSTLPFPIGVAIASKVGPVVDQGVREDQFIWSVVEST